MPTRLSQKCQDLISKMIVVDPTQRLDALGALKHQWFEILDEKGLSRQLSKVEQQEMDKQIVQRMQSYRGQSLLKKAAVNVLVKHLEAKQIETLKAEFEKIDTDCSGFIEVQELEKIIMDSDVQINPEEIQAIIKELDFAENKRINYSEFIAATINVSEYLTEERLQAIFNQFDIDNSGKITKDNMKQAFSKYGRDISEADIDDILQKHDLAGDQAISYDEFKKMILG